MSAPAGASSARVDIGGGAGVVPERKVSWRRRMQEKEERHQARMAEKEAKLSVLNEATRQEANRSQAPSADVYRCGAEKNRHRPVQVYAERDVNRYVSIFPAGLFPTRYVEQMRELLGTPARGRWHFALPQGSLPIVLDAPSGVLLAAGRDDRRCVVGVDFTPRTFFPLRFLHVPLRIVDATDRVHSVVVDVELLDDGTFRLQRLSGDDLPMATGALYDHTTVGRNLKKHYAAARLLRDVAGFLVGDAP